MSSIEAVWHHCIEMFVILAVFHLKYRPLSHWGRVTHICVSKLTIISSDNGLLPGWCQAIIWTNAEILLTGPLGTNFSEILIKIYVFSFWKMHWKLSPGKWDHFVSASMCHIGFIYISMTYGLIYKSVKNIWLLHDCYVQEQMTVSLCFMQ